MLERLSRLFWQKMDQAERLKKRQIEAAGGGPRAAGWRGTADLAATLMAAGPLVAARAELGAQNDPHLARAVAVLTSSLVGSGCVPRSQHQDETVRRELGRLFRHWSATADITGRTDFTGICRQIVRSMITTGDGFARFVWTDEPQPLQLQLVESRAVGRDTIARLGTGNEVLDGVEIDGFGRPVAFYVIVDERLAKVARIPAREMVHVFDQVTAGQMRGHSWLGPALTTARELDAYADAVLATARTAALFCGVVYDSDGSGIGGVDQGDGTAKVGIAPGSLWHAGPGKRVDFNQPPRLGDTAGFIKSYLRSIASALNVSYEQLSGDYEGVSYSSVRAGSNEHKRWVEQVQYSVIVPALLMPVWREFPADGRADRRPARPRPRGAAAGRVADAAICPCRPEERDRGRCRSHRGRPQEPRAGRRRVRLRPRNDRRPDPGGSPGQTAWNRTMSDLIHRRLALAPTTLDEKARTVDAIVSTGAGVPRRDTAGPYEERLAVDAIDPASLVGVPCLNSHRQGDLADILGVVTAARRDGGNLVVTIKLSERSAAVIRDIADGVVRGVSIGYQVDEWRETMVAGRRIKTAVRFAIREISLVAVPADPGATIRSEPPMDPVNTPLDNTVVLDRAVIDADIRRICDAAQIERQVADRLIAIGAEAADARKLALDAIRSQPLRVTTGRSADDPAERIEAMADGLYTRINPAHKPSDRGRSFAHLRLVDHAEQSVRAAGLSTTGLSQAEMVQRAMSTSDLPAVFAAVMNKGLRAAYESARRPMTDLSRERTAMDFRPLQRIVFDGQVTPLPVSENGEYKHGAFVDGKEAYAASRFGRLAGVSPETIVNDDTSALSRVPGEFGQAWANFEADQLVALLVSNAGAGPTLSDGNAVFHAAHGNVAGTGSAISVTSLSAAVAAMRKQKGLSGQTINIMPTVILVSPDQEALALSVVATLAPAVAGDVNPWSGKFKVAVDPGLVGNAWYVVATNVDGLEHAYVAGWRGPKVMMETDFDTSGLKMKMEGTFGAGFVDHRGWYRNVGA